MRVLILVEIASLGGHPILALTTGRELARRGHEVHFAGGDGPLADEIRKGFPFYKLTYYYDYGKRETYFRWRSLETFWELSRLTTEIKFDQIHCFDARSYILATILGILKKIPVTCTLCGYLAPFYNLPLSEKMIVFSQEQRDKLNKVFRWNEKNIEVIDSRLDMGQFRYGEKEEVSKLYKDYNLDPESKNIIMITNFLGPKVEAIKGVIEAIRPILGEFSDVRLILIGGRGAYFERAKEAGEEINRELGRKSVAFTGSVVNAYRFLPLAYIVMGVGRSAFEGMAYMKPTLIVGEKGYAGTVREENIKEISYYNFSGRNNREKVPPDELAKEIRRLLTDSEYYEGVRYFGLKFLREHIDIKAGIERIEKVYSENSLYAAGACRFFRACNLVRVLTPIMVDNYYNQIKYSAMQLLKLKTDYGYNDSPSAQ